MASVKTDRKLGSQVPGQVKQAPAETDIKVVKAPTPKPDAKKATKGGKQAGQRKAIDDESVVLESINKKQPLTKEPAAKDVKPMRKPQKRPIDDESKGECLSKQQTVAKDTGSNGGKPGRKPRRRSVDEDITTRDNL